MRGAERPTVLAGLLLAIGLFVGYAWFYQAGGWNQNSRFDLVRAIVERGTLRIDAYHANTGDKARHGGHYYSDKAPGLALAAVPVVAAARAVTDDVAALSWIATVATAALPTALAAWLLFAVALSLGASRGGAAFAALAYGLATPAWCYATLFFGHALATGCLVAAFAAAVALRRAGSGRRDALLAGGIGLGAGWATVTEFPAAVPAAIIAGLALAHASPGGRARLGRIAIGIAAGAGACVLALVAYNVAAFGAPLSVGYSSVEGFGGMKQGFLGVTYPKGPVLGEILFGRFRGLLPLAPALALAPLGFARLLAARPHRAAAAAAAAIAGYYVLFNASYVYWNGGWSYGPRHLAPALPFLALALAPLFAGARPALRGVLVALALWGAGLSLVAVSTTAQPPEGVRRPVGQLLWPAFRAGDLSLNHQSFLEKGADPARLRGGRIPHDAWNLGERLGLRGHASLAPLVVVWIGLAAAWLALVRRGRRLDPPP